MDRSAIEPTRLIPEEVGLPQTIPLPGRKDWGIGIIGFGRHAIGAHAPDYRWAGWPIVAVAVANPMAQKVAKEQFGVQRIYSDYRDLVNDDMVEVIDLLTQPTLREEAVMAAIEAGKPVITEKPLGRTIKECERMVEAAERARIPLAVHQNYRWMKGNFLAYHIVRQGWLGGVFFASVEVFGHQDISLANHPFYPRCDDFLTLHWNPHLADLLRYWTGSDAVRVSAHTARMTGQNFVSDNFFVSLEDFGSGLTGHILHCELLRTSLGGNRCRIDGDRGSLVFDFLGRSILLESQALGPGVFMLDASGLNYPESICGSMGDFLLAIEEGREPMVSGRENLGTMRTVFAEIKSAKSDGEWILVNGIAGDPTRREEQP